MDHAATTPVRKEVVDAMMPYFTEHFGNPSSVYGLADESKKAISYARNVIAKSINAEADNIYFTSGGTESDNWAIKGVAEAYADKGKHIITSKIEHHAVLHTCEYLETKGYEVTYLDVDCYGIVDVDQLISAIRPDTILISIMYANNEIGTIQPIKAIGDIANRRDILFHTDAVQAFGHIPVDVEECHIDLLSASGHKLGAPKGIGMLYVRDGVDIGSYMHGGQQENKQRAGTENVPSIVGFGKAVEIAETNMLQDAIKTLYLTKYLLEQLKIKIPDVQLNGHPLDRLSNNINITLPSIEGESLMALLDTKGISVSTGSACNSGSVESSHVLLALGLSADDANCSIRITVGIENTKEDMDYVTDTVGECTDILRRMSNAK